MTGQDIYELASSFLYEKDGEDADSKGFAIGFLNILLQEALPIENSVRRREGKEHLKRAPYLKTLAEEIDYCDQILRAALPYGLASWYFQEALDNFQAENYRSKYLAGLDDAKKHISGEVKDVYGW